MSFFRKRWPVARLSFDYRIMGWLNECGGRGRYINEWYTDGPRMDGKRGKRLVFNDLVDIRVRLSGEVQLGVRVYANFRVIDIPGLGFVGFLDDCGSDREVYRTMEADGPVGILFLLFFLLDFLGVAEIGNSYTASSQSLASKCSHAIRWLSSFDFGGDRMNQFDEEKGEKERGENRN